MAAHTSEMVRGEIAAAYAAGEGMRPLSRRLGVSIGTIHRHVHKRGVPARPREEKTADAVAATAVAEYLAGGDVAPIAARAGISKNTLLACVRRAGHPVRPAGSPRTHALREDAFDAPLSTDARYWCGMLLADGSVSDAGKLVFALASKDAAHVHALAAFLGTDAPVTQEWHTDGKGGSFPAHRLTVCSMRLAAALAALGITPRKSGREEMHPSLLRCRDAWRGLVDGDGWLRSNRTQAEVGLTGSRVICGQFLDFIGPLEPRPPFQPNGTIWTVALTGRNARRAAAILYRGASVSLARKREIAERIITVHDAWGDERPYHGRTPKPR